MSSNPEQVNNPDVQPGVATVAGSLSATLGTLFHHLRMNAGHPLKPYSQKRLDQTCALKRTVERDALLRGMNVTVTVSISGVFLEVRNNDRATFAELDIWAADKDPTLIDDVLRRIG